MTVSRLDTAGVAAAVGLSVYRVRELARHRRAAEAAAQGGDERRAEQARRYLREEALPAPLAGPGTRVWSRAQVLRWGERTRRLDALLAPQRKPAPGRSPGGPPALPRHRPSLSEQAAAFEAVPVDPLLEQALRPLVQALYLRLRARGERAAEARSLAARMAAHELRALSVQEAQAMRVMLAVAIERAAAGQGARMPA